MGLDTFCLICGGPNYFKLGHGNDLKMSNKELLEYKWLGLVMGIDKTEKWIELGDEPDDGSGNYYNFIVQSKMWHEYDTKPKNSFIKYPEDYGVVAHKDCLKLLENKLNYKLRFADVCRLVDDYNNLIKRINYGEIKKYQKQWFDYDKAYEKDEWLMKSPLKNKENQERVLKIWKPLVA